MITVCPLRRFVYSKIFYRWRCFSVISMKYLEYFLKCYKNSTILLKSSWNMMKFDAQHQYPNLLRTWVWGRFSYLEQIPKAFSGSRPLPELSFISIIFALIDRTLFSGDVNYNFDKLFLLFYRNICEFLNNSKQFQKIFHLVYFWQHCLGRVTR